MFSRIASRIQELFTFGADYRRQKRPLDLSDCHTPVLKRPRLADIGDLDSEVVEKDIEENLCRPGLTRTNRRSVSSVEDFADSNLDYKTVEVRKDGAQNGFESSYFSGKTSNNSGCSFTKEEHRLNTQNPPSPNHSQQPPTNGDVSSIEELTTTPSIFRNWLGFKQSLRENPIQSTRNVSRVTEPDRYLHKKVKTNEFAIKQCIRMEEKKRYKAMLARYVSPSVLEDIGFEKKEVPWTSPEVITIIDSDSDNSKKSNLSPGAAGSSPIIIGSSRGSPCSATGSTVSGSRVRRPPLATPWYVRNPRTGDRTASASSTRSLNYSDHETTSWKAVEKKMERASNLLEEFTRPVVRGGKSCSWTPEKNQLELSRSSSKEVIIIVGEEKSTASGRTANRSTSFSRNRNSHHETINIEDSDSSSSHEATTQDKSETPSFGSYVRPGLRSLKEFESSLRTSPFIRQDFLKNLLDSTEERVRSLKVKETEAELTEMRKMREERDAMCNEKISNLIRLTRRLPVPLEETFIELDDEEEDDDDVLIEEEESPKDGHPELTDKQEEMVNRALKSNNPERVLSEAFKLQITSRDMSTLGGLNWLNDEVINFYLNLMVDRCKSNKKFPPVYAFNTFFYPKVVVDGQRAVHRWTKNIDIFTYSYILVPVHLGMHWCLAVIDLPKKEIRYYDSMGGNNDKCLDALFRYLVDEMKDKKKQVFDTTGWKKINVKGIPQQMNGSDCGMFACKFAEYITRNARITFNQSHMPYFRRRMVYEILTKQLM